VPTSRPRPTPAPKVLRCADVIPRCPVVIEGQNEKDVLARGKDHVRTDHHIPEIPPPMLARLRGAIRDKKPRR
jgi:predicted small metal-binding protein